MSEALTRPGDASSSKPRQAAVEAGPMLVAGRRGVDVVIPVYNEENALAGSVAQLSEYLSTRSYQWKIVIVDNASTDTTWEIAQRLASQHENVEAIHIDRKGRGLALRTAWEQSKAEIVAYMDVDLSTNLNAFSPLVAPLLSAHSDIAIGSRIGHHARVRRQAKREILSRGYNLLIRSLLGTRFSDAQCGFKAARTESIIDLLPQVKNDSWFFDTELLVLAERAGKRIFEVPVDWIEDLDSRVNIPKTVMEDVMGLLRLRWGFWVHAFSREK